MNKCFALSSLLLLLAFCGGTQASSVNAAEYFDALEASIKAGLKNDAIGFLCDTGHAKAQLTSQDGVTAVEIRPFVFDARVKGIHATTIEGVTASIVGKTNKHEESRVYATGPGIPDSLNTALDGLPLAIDIYVADSTAYFDFSKSGVLRTAISNALIEEYPDYQGIMPRCHKKLDEYSEIEKYMPVDAKLDEYATTLKEELEKSYSTSPSAFAFAQENGVSSISFQTTSWSTVRTVLEREELEASSIDLSSFFDQAEEKATLDRCRLDLKFDANGLQSFGVDIAFTFKQVEASSDSYAPSGTWELSGIIEISHGEKATPVAIKDSLKKQCLQNEFTLPF